MLESPVLVVMAAGMGSRYGGLKQIDAMDDYGNTLINFSLFDAHRAGFENVLFIIRHEIEKDFMEVMGSRLSRFRNVEFVYQELDDLPSGMKIPSGRKKPYGTTHALFCAAEKLMGKSFMTINADDFYGFDSYRLAYDFLTQNTLDNTHGMIGYDLVNTLSPSGYVSRGVCVTDKDGFLSHIDERKRIVLRDGKGAFTLDEGKTFETIPDNSVASMNMWLFNRGFIDSISESFPERLREGLENMPLAFEETITEAVTHLLDHSTVMVIPTTSEWFGVTYKEDKPMVRAEIEKLRREGKYPARTL